MLSDRALRSVHRELKLEKVKVSGLAKQAKQDAEKVRELEQTLAAAEKSVKTRTAALDTRERALNKKEANIQAEISRAVTKIKNDYEAKERQLLQDRLAFAAIASRRKIENNIVSPVEDRSDIPSDQSNSTSATNTASAVSHELRCSSEARSSVSTPPKASKLLYRQSSTAQPANTGLHRVAKRYNLRNQAVASASAAPDTGKTKMPVSRLPRYKLRSDGDLEGIALGAGSKENVPLRIVREPSVASAVPASISDKHKPAILKPDNGKKMAARTPKATHPSGVPIYHLRSAAARKNAAMDLRRVV